jgi:Eisosome protein 1
MYDIGGKYMSREEIDAIAQKHVDEVLGEINKSVELKRQHLETTRVEREKRQWAKEAAAAEKAKERDKKKMTTAGNKARLKEEADVKKEEAKTRKEDAREEQRARKAAKEGEARQRKEEQKARKEEDKARKRLSKGSVHMVEATVPLPVTVSPPVTVPQEGFVNGYVSDDTGPLVVGTIIPSNLIPTGEGEEPVGVQETVEVVESGEIEEPLQPQELEQEPEQPEVPAQSLEPIPMDPAKIIPVPVLQPTVSTTQPPSQPKSAKPKRFLSWLHLKPLHKSRQPPPEIKHPHFQGGEEENPDEELHEPQERQFERPATQEEEDIYGDQMISSSNWTDPLRREESLREVALAGMRGVTVEDTDSGMPSEISRESKPPVESEEPEKPVSTEQSEQLVSTEPAVSSSHSISTEPGVTSMHPVELTDEHEADTIREPRVHLNESEALQGRGYESPLHVSAEGVTEEEQELVPPRQISGAVEGLERVISGSRFKEEF